MNYENNSKGSTGKDSPLPRPVLYPSSDLVGNEAFLHGSGYHKPAGGRSACLTMVTGYHNELLCIIGGSG